MIDMFQIWFNKVLNWNYTDLRLKLSYIVLFFTYQVSFDGFWLILGYFDDLSFWDPKEQSFWPSDQVGLLLVGLSALKRLISHG